MKDAPAPNNVKQVQSFLGLANYYRKFVRSFAHISSPLTHLLKKQDKFIWKEEQQKAFETLKEKLITDQF